MTTTSAHAGMFDVFMLKVKDVLFLSATEKEEESSLSYKTAILAPSLAFVEEEEEQGDLLEVRSGPMRLSTEDVDYPLEDTITTYEVKSGDSIASVAKLFNVTQNTILWANDIPNRKISQGDVLVILPVTGIKYRIKQGDTLASVAKKYKGNISEIAKYNGIGEDAGLALGDELIIPDGEVSEVKSVNTSKKTVKKLTTAPAGFFVKPLLMFRKTQGIHGKNAVDLAAKAGAPVVATASGKIILSKIGGYNGGYGTMVVIAHKNNVQTLYAHLSSTQVKTGDSVEQGQVIGAVGNSGRSTGPHLHIEVRGAVNPF